MITVIPDYISEQYEEKLLSKFPKRAKSNREGRNSITRFGSSKPYKARVQSHIPEYFNPILSSLKKDSILDSDSITVNEYHPTQSINWHIDSLSSGPVIVVLSLKGDAVMGLRNLTTNEHTDIPLPARSLLVLTDEHRYDWEHCIHPLTSHRYSIVFRKGDNI